MASFVSGSAGASQELHLPLDAHELELLRRPIAVVEEQLLASLRCKKKIFM
jgi:hypothetical protein